MSQFLDICTLRKQKHSYIFLRLRPYSHIMSLIIPLITLVLLISIIALQSFHFTFAQAKSNEPLVTLPGSFISVLNTPQEKEAVDDKKVMLLTLALRPRHMAKLEEALIHRSIDQNMLTAKQYQDQFSPDPMTYQMVEQFLQQSGFTITRTYSHRLLIEFRGPTAKVAESFHVKLQAYHGTDGQTYYLNKNTFSLPTHLAKYILNINWLIMVSNYAECQKIETAAMMQEEYILWKSATIQGKKLSELAQENTQTLCANDRDTFIQLAQQDQTGAPAILKIEAGFTLTLSEHRKR